MPTNAELLMQIDDATRNLGGVNGIMPEDANTPNEREDYTEDADTRLLGTRKSLDLLDQYMDDQEEMADELNLIPAIANKNIFSLIKKSQMMRNSPMADPMMDPMGAPLTMEEPVIDEGSVPGESFATVTELKRFIDKQLDDPKVDKAATIDSVVQYFTAKVSDDSEQNVNDSLKRYLQFRGQLGITPQDELEMLEPVFEALPKSSKTPEYGIGENVVPGKRSVAQLVTESNETIRKMAQRYVKANSSNGKFNLKRFAQHKGFENAFMYGPSEKRIDPFINQPISDWHIMERNKGFGLVVDDIWNIDWENIWRSTVMDKYSRPYRDNEGNWVGGYIEKRFETDKLIPKGNNYQLLPGQRRKPNLPQHGLTEARMEYMRSQKDRGYEPDSDGNPTDWNDNGYAKIASSNGFNLKISRSQVKKKVAQ